MGRERYTLLSTSNINSDLIAIAYCSSISSHHGIGIKTISILQSDSQLYTDGKENEDK